MQNMLQGFPLFSICLLAEVFQTHSSLDCRPLALFCSSLIVSIVIQHSIATSYHTGFSCTATTLQEPYGAQLLRSPMVWNVLSNSSAKHPLALRPIWAGCPPSAAGLHKMAKRLNRLSLHRICVIPWTEHVQLQSTPCAFS